MRKWAVMLIVLVMVASVLAFPSKHMNYQGKLTDPTGVAIEGTVNIRFSIWTAEVGGSEIWNETIPVEMNHGLFDAILGYTNPLNIDFSNDLWIELRIGTETLSPRQPLSPVAYSYHAQVADSVVGGVILDHNSLTGLQGGDPVGGEFYHLTSSEYGNLHEPQSDNQDLFASITDGTDTCAAATETDQIKFTGSGGATVTVDGTTGEVTIDASSAGDLWGSQVVRSDGSLNGDGTSTTPLSVEWGNVTQHDDVTDAGSGIIISDAERAQITTNETNIGDLLYTENNYITDSEPLTESVDKLDMAIEDVVGGTSGSYIQNQDASAQAADFHIDGDGTIDGSLQAGDIIGQGSASDEVSSTVAITSPTTPVTLSSITYSVEGGGSNVHLDFSGNFDDKGGQDGAYVTVELVRDPGAGEVIIATSQISIFSPVVYQLCSFAISGVDSPPAGSHTYSVRAKVSKEPYTAGRCLEGILRLAEIKE